MKLLLVIISLLVLAGCQERQFTGSQIADQEARNGAATGDKVWLAYADMRGRGFTYGHYGWIGPGRKITQADIDAAPCKVVTGADESYYCHEERTVYLDRNARISTLSHELQHFKDMSAGITDRRELEMRAMLAESGEVP